MDNENILFCMPDLSININTILITPSHKCRDIHFHKEIEIVRVDCGKILCYVENREFCLSKGDMLFINSNVLHKISCYENEAKCTYLQIDIDSYSHNLVPDGEKYFYAFMHDKQMSKYCVVNDKNELSGFFDEIKKELENKLSSFDLYIKANIFHIIAFMCRNGLSPDYSSLFERNTVLKILPSVKYANQNYKSKISLDNVSQTINMDKFYFCKLFKNATGSTFTHYINFLRIRHAEELLSDTNKNISEIALECGFSSIQHFNSIFKKHRNCTPKDYRKLNRRISQGF